MLAINESIAVGPVLRVLGEDPVPAIRAMASRILGGIPGPEAANGLVGRFLQEEDEERPPDDHERTGQARLGGDRPSPRSIAAVDASSDRQPIGLGPSANLNAVAMVPRLIPALVTIEYELIWVDSGTGSSGTSFNTGQASNGVGVSSRSIPVLTPPVVGSGSAAYGATSVPYGSSNFSVGSGGGLGPVQKLVPVEYRNDEVLAALVKMTGRDFGYDINTWKQWVATSFKVDAPPTRRVREP